MVLTVKDVFNVLVGVVSIPIFSGGYWQFIVHYWQWGSQPEQRVLTVYCTLLTAVGITSRAEGTDRLLYTVDSSGDHWQFIAHCWQQWGSHPEWRVLTVYCTLLTAVEITPRVEGTDSLLYTVDSSGDHWQFIVHCWQQWGSHPEQRVLTVYCTLLTAVGITTRAEGTDSLLYTIDSSGDHNQSRGYWQFIVHYWQQWGSQPERRVLTVYCTLLTAVGITTRTEGTDNLLYTVDSSGDHWQFIVHCWQQWGSQPETLAY
jgi:transposase